MIKFTFDTEESFNKATQQAKERNVKLTYKNTKPFRFPSVVVVEQIWKGDNRNRHVGELQFYNINDFTKESFNINDLLYSEVLYKSETDVSFDFGKAYIKGIMYKDDNKSNEIDYLYINYINEGRTGDEFSDKVRNLVGAWKDRIFLDDIIKIIK